MPRDRRGAVGINLRRNRPLSALLLSVFVVMIGYGVALTVLPVYTERIHGLGGASNRLVAFHLGVLRSVFALAQLATGPSVGRLGDRVGRRPLILAVLAGVGVTEAAFAFTSSLWWLYALRVAGGVAASLLTVGALAAIADQTSEDNRAQGMAWFGTAISLGVVAGPLLGGLLGGAGTIRLAGLRFDGYTLPFLAAGTLGAGRWGGGVRLRSRVARSRRTTGRPRQCSLADALVEPVAGSCDRVAVRVGPFRGNLRALRP